MSNTTTNENVSDLEARLVSDSIQFISTLTELYGNDKGMELWNKFGDVVGTDLQGKVFFAMLSGATGNGVLRIRTDTAKEVVSTIKCIREYTGYGLKEAKDAYDNARDRVTEVQCIDRKLIAEFARNLRFLGCKVL